MSPSRPIIARARDVTRLTASQKLSEAEIMAVFRTSRDDIGRRVAALLDSLP